MLNITIEGNIQAEELNAINLIISLSQTNSLDQLYLTMENSKHKLTSVLFGRGGSHIWVADSKTHVRILIITKT